MPEDMCGLQGRSAATRTIGNARHITGQQDGKWSAET